MLNFKRICPGCGEELVYTTKYTKNTAEKRNAKCKSCAKIGKSFSDERKKKISESLKGIKRSEETRKRISKSCKGENHSFYGKKRPEHSKRMSGKNNPMYHKKISAEKRLEIDKNIRLSVIKRIENRCGQISPNYNSKAIPIIEEYGRKHGFNFCHAENGGEVCINGYFPDGLDEKRKTIIEIDERHHFDNSGKLRQKDKRRQNYLEGLGYKFIRVRI